MIWKDKRDIHMLMNMHHLPAEGNFCDEHGNALKPAIVQDYNKHTGHVDKSDCMMNTYSISRQTWKQTNYSFTRWQRWRICCSTMRELSDKKG
jgi:hypothetical protein